MRLLSLCLALVLSLSLSACGQKGPLVLPDNARAHKRLPPPKSPPPAPATTGSSDGGETRGDHAPQN